MNQQKPLRPLRMSFYQCDVQNLRANTPSELKNFPVPCVTSCSKPPKLRACMCCKKVLMRWGGSWEKYSSIIPGGPRPCGMKQFVGLHAPVMVQTSKPSKYVKEINVKSVPDRR